MRRNQDCIHPEKSWRNNNSTMSIEDGASPLEGPQVTWPLGDWRCPQRRGGGGELNQQTITLSVPDTSIWALLRTTQGVQSSTWIYTAGSDGTELNQESETPGTTRVMGQTFPVSPEPHISNLFAVDWTSPSSCRTHLYRHPHVSIWLYNRVLLIWILSRTGYRSGVASSTLQ